MTQFQQLQSKARHGRCPKCGGKLTLMMGGSRDGDRLHCLMCHKDVARPVSEATQAIRRAQAVAEAYEVAKAYPELAPQRPPQKPVTETIDELFG